MSVAVGIAQPRIASASSRLSAANSNAGTSTPPAAQAIGSSSCSRSDNWPLSASRLISSATSRKNTAIRPSLIHHSTGLLPSGRWRKPW